MKINITFFRVMFFVMLCSFAIAPMSGAQEKQNVQEINIEQVVRANPNDAVAYYNLGEMYFKQEEYKKAIAAYEKAIQIASDYAEAYCSLGRAYGKTGKCKKSKDSFERAIEINPNYAEAHYLLGVLAYNHKRYGKSMESIKRAVEINPKYAKAYSFLGLIYERKPSTRKEAIETYEQAIRFDPNDAKTYHRLGRLYSKLGLWEQAIQAYRQEIRLRIETVEPIECADAYRDISQAYFRLGWWEWTDRAHNLDPSLNPVYQLAYEERLRKRVVTTEPMLIQAEEGYKQEIRLRRGIRGQRANCAIAYGNLSNVFDRMAKKKDKDEALRAAFLMHPLWVMTHTIVGAYLLAVCVALGFLCSFIKSIFEQSKKRESR